MTKTTTTATLAYPPTPGFFARFTVLKSAVRELWVVFGAKLLAILAYSIMNLTLVLWLSSDLGYSDKRAGAIVSMWSAIMTLCTVLVGSLTDAIGLRKSFLLGISICVVARGVMTFTGSHAAALAVGLFPLAVGEALMGPVMVAATKRYATTAQRSISFSIVYATMNIGFLIANYVFDYVRKGLGEYGHFTVPIIGAHLTTYRTLFFISFAFTIPNFLLIYFCIRGGIEVTDDGAKIVKETPKYPGQGIIVSTALTVRDAGKETARIFGGLWRQPGFYRFLLFLALASFMRLIFLHMNYTFPKFGIRELGAGAPVGRLSAINNIIIIFLVPLVGALTQRVSAYRMVVIGSWIAASSVFFMAIPSEMFEPLADGWLGHFIAHTWLNIPGEVNPWYVMIVLFVVMLSVGEAFYSPRLYEYAAVIAPPGQEASYMAMSYLPFFVAKLFVGYLSGWLLSIFCPATGPRHSEMLWLVIALTTMIAPIGLVVLRNYIRVKEPGRES